MSMMMINFALSFHHQYSINTIEGLIPWERDVYIQLITDYIKAENERIAAENAKQSQR